MEQVKTVAGTALLGLIALSAVVWKLLVGFLRFYVGAYGSEKGSEETDDSSQPIASFYDFVREDEENMSDEEYFETT